MSKSDRHYIERCLDGHPNDFGYLVDRYTSMIVANLTGKLGNKDHGEEAAQETFVRAYFNINKLKKPDSFYAWLLGIADRIAKEQRRKRQIQLKQEELSSIRETGTAIEQKPDMDLRRAISMLPDAYRKVILLKYYGERSCSQIAEQLEISLFTATKRLSRAYVLLRQSLKLFQGGKSGGAR
ncbi:MAG: RNA polymerase sigma factor [Sedimentisphaerales bacterium]|nr:RNA polymerase sigma factor [Sedimentisphaerales bacterium]